LNLIKSDYIVPSPKVLLSEEKILSLKININSKNELKALLQTPQRVALLKNVNSTTSTVVDDDDPTNLTSKSTTTVEKR